MWFSLFIILKEKISASLSMDFVRSCVYVVEHSTETSIKSICGQKKRTYVQLSQDIFILTTADCWTKMKIFSRCHCALTKQRLEMEIGFSGYSPSYR